MTWTPTPDGGRYAFKEGMTGWDVYGLQQNLPVSRDGVFGPATTRAVTAFQAAQKLEADGIAGGRTQEMLCRVLSRPSTKDHNLPFGLLRSVCQSESGYYIASCTAHPSDDGYDLGPYQDSIMPSERTQARYAHAFRIAEMADELGAEARASHDEFYGRAGASTHKRAWQLAALHWNWQTAAINMSYGYGPYRDAARNDQPEQWIITASGGRLRTPNEWVAFQIEKKTLYVTTWPA